jgi:hypothetical protein
MKNNKPKKSLRSDNIIWSAASLAELRAMLDGVVFSEDFSSDGGTESTPEADSGGESSDVSTTPTFSLDFPWPITVADATPKIGGDGSGVVDVILEWDDVVGASEYEVRVTKL